MRLKGAVRSASVRLRLGSLLRLTTASRLYGGTDKASHGYTDLYHEAFRKRRYGRNLVLEIGVGGYESASPSGSLRLWRDYFPRSTVVGFDLYDKRVELGRRVQFVRGDQSNSSDLLRVVDALGGAPTIVIDDGSHHAGHAEASFRTLFPLMLPGSLYCIEDLHTSFWAPWGGATPPGADTAVGLAQDLVVAVQCEDPTFRRRPRLGPAPAHWARGIARLLVAPGLAIVEKGPSTSDQSSGGHA